MAKKPVGESDEVRLKKKIAVRVKKQNFQVIRLPALYTNGSSECSASGVRLR